MKPEAPIAYVHNIDIKSTLPNLLYRYFIMQLQYATHDLSANICLSVSVSVCRTRAL